MKDWPRMMNEEMAGEYVGLKKRTMQDRRQKMMPPRFIKIGSAVRYLKEDLDAFIEGNRVDPLEAA
jgi:hypothetical protein